MSIDLKKLRIAIIGAGIGGLTTALALHRAGVSCTVYEQAPQLNEIGAGITLWENALKVLRHLGVSDDLILRGQLIKNSYLGLSNGTLLKQMHIDDLSSHPSSPQILAIHRAQLQQVLFHALPQDTVSFNHRCTQLKEKKDTVTVQFDNGNEIECDLLIGADGIHSVIRAKRWDNSPLRYFDQATWRGISPSQDHWPKHQGGEFWGPNARFRVIPISESQLYWFAVQQRPVNHIDPAETRKATLLNVFKGWSHSIPNMIKHTPTHAILYHPLIDRPPISRWNHGAVTLLGDSVHPTTPNLGQGACMAIESAQILVNVLHSSRHLKEALTRYQTLRQPRTTWVTLQSQKTNRIALQKNIITYCLRNTLMRFWPKKSQLKLLQRLVLYDATRIGTQPLEIKSR